MEFDKSPNLKYQAVTVNSAKENCGIRKNLSCYDCKYRDKYLPLLRIDDSFMKYVITGDLIKKYQNDAGIVFMDVFDFLLDKDSI